MPKRLKYLTSSVVNVVVFMFLFSLSYESRYYGLLISSLVLIFTSWFALGLNKKMSQYIRWMSIMLPVAFLIGYGLFAALLPYSFILSLFLSLFFGVVTYVIYLVENVFLFAIGFKTVPLYRAAYTVGLIILLITSFFLFDSMFSFSLIYWINGILAFLISIFIFSYHYFCVTIELPDDGLNKDIKAYIYIPSLLVSEMAIILSFWPVGIFKGSIYLVSIIYILSGLLQADLRERLFKRTWMSFLWTGLAVVLGVIVMTGWR